MKPSSSSVGALYWNKEGVNLTSFQFFLTQWHLRGKLRNAALSPRLWHILESLMLHPAPRQQETRNHGQSSIKNLWQDPSPWHSNPPAWKSSVESSAPGLFLQDLITFFPGRLRGPGGRVLQATAWPKTMMGSAFWSARSSHGFSASPTGETPGERLLRVP